LGHHPDLPRDDGGTGREAGTTVLNGPAVSDPRLPFGGIKESGCGRELGGYGIKEFMNAKTVDLR